MIERSRPITAVLPMFFCINRLLLVSASRCQSSLIDRLIKSISMSDPSLSKLRGLLMPSYISKKRRLPFCFI
nr:MAG TPA: hypothetical protein [Caudoviricetes sp.]